MSLSLVATNEQVTVTLYYSFFNRVTIFKPWPTIAMSSTDVIMCWFTGLGQGGNTLLIQLKFATSLYIGKIQRKKKTF